MNDSNANPREKADYKKSCWRSRKSLKTVAMYCTMVTVSTLAIYWLEPCIFRKRISYGIGCCHRKNICSQLGGRDF